MKTPDDIELDEACGLCLEADDQRDRRDGEHDDAIGVGQAVAATHHLVRRKESRDRTEARVGKPLNAVFPASTRMKPVTTGDQNEQHGSVPEHRGSDL